MDQPEPIPANSGHMRIDNSNRSAHRHHGFNGVSALLQNGTTGLGGQMMRGCDGGPTKTGRFFHGLFLYIEYLFWLLAGRTAIKPLAPHLDPI